MDLNSEKDWNLKLNDLKNKAETVKIISARDAYEQAKQKAILKDKGQLCHYYRIILNIKDLLSKIIQEAINKGEFSISIGKDNNDFKFPRVKDISSAMLRLCDYEFRANQKLADEIIEWLEVKGYKASYRCLMDPFTLYNLTISWVK